MSNRQLLLGGSLLVLAFVGGVVAQGQAERFELLGNLKFFGSGNGIIFADGSKQTTAGSGEVGPAGPPGPAGVGAPLRVVDSQGAELGVLGGLEFTGGGSPFPESAFVIRFVNGQAVLLRGVTSSGFFFFEMAELYYESSNCTGTAYMLGQNVLVSHAGLTSSPQVLRFPATPFVVRTHRSLFRGGGCEVSDVTFLSGVATPIDLSAFVPPYSVVR